MPRLQGMGSFAKSLDISDLAHFPGVALFENPTVA